MEVDFFTSITINLIKFKTIFHYSETPGKYQENNTKINFIVFSMYISGLGQRFPGIILNPLLDTVSQIYKVAIRC